MPTPGRFTHTGELDPDQISELCQLDPDGSAGFLVHMVADYEGTAAECLPAIRIALESADPYALEEAAHKLKGAASQVGARAVQDASARLVALARSGSMQGGGEVLAELESAQPRTSSALKSVIAEVERADIPLAS